MKEPIKMYLASDKELAEEDILTDDDWGMLVDIYHGLKPFWDTTLRLEGYGAQGSHGVIWEVLPAFEFLLNHVEKQAEVLRLAQ